MVHPSALGDALTAARHRAFIAPRLIGGIAALASFPLYLTARGALGRVELLVFGWLVAPILVAYFLSRTGRYESAQLLSSVALTGLVTMVAAATGGIGSFAAIWLVVVPFEAAVSGSRRAVVAASGLALGAAVLLALFATEHLSPLRTGEGILRILGVVSAVLCATGLALTVEALARTSLGLRRAEEARYHLLAGNMTDVITRHGDDGGVLFVSPAAAAIFGAPLGMLHGQGLFERVHVADRPAYLIALGDAAVLAESRSIEIRVRSDGMSEDGCRRSHYRRIEMHCRPVEKAHRGALDGARREVVSVLREVGECRPHVQRPDRFCTDAVSPNVRETADPANVQSLPPSPVPQPQPVRAETAVRRHA